MRFEINNIVPMGAVRMTRKGKYKDEAAQRYLNYKKVIYYEILKQIGNVYNPIDAAIRVNVLFKMPIQESWPKEKKAEAVGTFHTKKPDVDNLVKGLFDAINGLVWIDDNRVAEMVVTKKYSNEPGIVFDVESIGGLSYGQTTETKTQSKTKQRSKRQAESRAGRNIRARI